MVRALTPVRIARISRASFQSTEETAELDFELSVRQGVLIHACEFGVASAVHVATADNDQDQFYLSLHAETGELENAADGFLDALVLNSEIIGEAIGQVSSSATAGEETGVHFDWLSPISWRYDEVMGAPLLLAGNLTFRGKASSSALTVNGAFARVFYQYVTLTDQELARQFILRR